MTNLKPWYKVVIPREDLREGKPLDAAEFAVHLDKVREGDAPEDYKNPARFFERTYLTQNLKGLASEVIRRLSGEKTETSAVFNLATQFGGGKTHALTLLYHLAENGKDAEKWQGVKYLVESAGARSNPNAKTAVFVGTEFDSITGRGGNDGTPLRKTPWGEIAFQLSGKEGFSIIAEHEKQMTAPGGDVIRKFLPKDIPCLILMDELMNYMSRNRKSGLSSQLYSFVQNLSEETRSRSNMVLAVSIPASELEMNAEDQSDYERFKKMLDRLGKAVILAAESETSEIIRRRLFEWGGGLPADANPTCAEYAEWIRDHRQQIPQWFPIDQAHQSFAATYPFHPAVLSVFERKWQALPRFQRTRGILRLLALWVSRAYSEGYKGAHKDPLIGLGTAPLEDSVFRTAAFEQLGEPNLEGPVTTDICGKPDSHAMRLDKEAPDTIKKSRLHRKVATSIFFESNGGQTKAIATTPEIRLAVAEPELDIGNVETALEALASACYFLTVEGNAYRFSLALNLNKLLADRRASIASGQIDECVRSEIQKVFGEGKEVERVYFPEKSNQISDRPFLTFVVLAPEHSLQEDQGARALVETMTQECGKSNRTFKNALICCVPENSSALREEARKLLAWEAIRDEEGERLIDTQKRQLAEGIKRSQRDLKETVWRTYKYIMMLGKDNSISATDLGLVHSSAAESITDFILERLRKDGEVEKEIGPRILEKNWPPAFREWSTKSVRDAIFASPQFPRLLNPDTIKATIAIGVTNRFFAYVGKGRKGEYDPFYFGGSLLPADIEISDDMFIVTKQTAEEHLKAKEIREDDQSTPEVLDDSSLVTSTEPSPTKKPETVAKKLTWTGSIPHQKWMNFYTKVLSRFAVGGGLKITVNVEVTSEQGISSQKVEETKVALRELNMSDDVKTD